MLERWGKEVDFFFFRPAALLLEKEIKVQVLEETVMLWRLGILLVVAALVLAGCGGAPAESADEGAPTEELRPVTMALPFIPNVQFAMFYVAAEKGYYREAGLDVAFDYNFETDVVQRTAQGNVDFAMAGATSVLLARQQGLPIVTVATIYQQFPVVFFSKTAQAIASVPAMADRSVGLPGRFGDSYYALLAMLYANDMQEADLDIQEIGFTQVEALLTDQVEVATGYAMNEPVLLRQQGEELNIIRVADEFPLASNGIIASEQMIAEDAETVQAFVTATMRGLADTLANSDEAFELSLAQIPEAELGDPELQRTVLEESLPYWQSELTETNGLGYIDGASWQQTEQFMQDTGLLSGPVEVAAAFTNAFVE